MSVQIYRKVGNNIIMETITPQNWNGLPKGYYFNPEEIPDIPEDSGLNLNQTVEEISEKTKTVKKLRKELEALKDNDPKYKKKGRPIGSKNKKNKKKGE